MKHIFHLRLEVVHINTTEKFIKNFEQWRKLNDSFSIQKVRDNLHEVFDPFVKEVQKISAEYDVSNNHAACYVSNYADDYIFKRFNGGCENIALCERISNAIESKEVRDETQE